MSFFVYLLWAIATPKRGGFIDRGVTQSAVITLGLSKVPEVTRKVLMG